MEGQRYKKLKASEEESLTLAELKRGSEILLVRKNTPDIWNGAVTTYVIEMTAGCLSFVCGRTGTILVARYIELLT